MTAGDQVARLKENMSINSQNHLEISGVDTVELAEKYGTPLYVYDTGLVKQTIRVFKEAFEKHEQPYQVAYASKAFSSLALYQLLAKENISLDVVSGGELHLAIQAGFPVEKIHFHGNNKSDEELIQAVQHGVGCIVVDNFVELRKLKEIVESHRQTVAILLRVTPGIEAHTHEYISTGQEDSKFGFDLNSGQAEEAVKEAKQCDYLHVRGLHSHIGSQIFETNGFEAVVKALLTSAKDWRDKFDFQLEVLNVGGGFGIKYTDEDRPLELSAFVDTICETLEKEVGKLDMKTPEVWIEPGRSIVGEAGTTLYTIGTEKNLPNIRHYVSVDGGMSDNIRPALYEAKYTAVAANKVNSPTEEKLSIAGKACESGDMLIWDLNLPKLKKNDILAVLSTGAYGYAMASNYNRLPKPAVVFVENGKEFLAIRRETYDDFMRLEKSIFESDFL